MSDNEQYQPTEAQISALMSRTPRQLAIGYIRAQRRANELKASLELMVKIHDAKTYMRESYSDALKSAQKLWGHEGPEA